MYIVILTYAATTAQEIAAEKGTKIMEVIFQVCQQLNTSMVKF